MKRRLSIRALGFVILTSLLAVSLSLAEDPASANRDNVLRSLRGLALRAQIHYGTPCSDGGGCGSFATLTLSQLTNKPTNAYGSYVLSSPGARSVTLTGVGIEPGFDGSTRVMVYMVVYSDSMTFVAAN